VCYYDVVIGARIEAFMGIAVARTAAELPSVKCRICGRKSPLGARLCDECVAAVKRARHVSTVSSQFMPQILSRPERMARMRGSRPAPPTREGIRSMRPTGPVAWGTVVALAIFAGAICATGYFAVQEIDDTSGESAMVATPAPMVAPRVAPPSANTDDSILGKPEGRDVAPAAEVASSTPVPVPAVPAPKPAARRTSAEFRSGKAAATAADPRAANRGADGDTGPSSPDEAGTVAAPVTVARPAAPAEPAVPDRWELMNAALARCSSEGFLAGVVCTERARLQYCDGYWGAVPQCRGATHADDSR
jgi:hypothetical protein